MRAFKWTIFLASILNSIGFCIYSIAYEKELAQLKGRLITINQSLTNTSDILADLNNTEASHDESLSEIIEDLTDTIFALRDSLNICCPENVSKPKKPTETLKSIYYSKIKSDTISYRLNVIPDKLYDSQYNFVFYLINDMIYDITVAKSATFDPANCQVIVNFPFAQTISSKDSAAFEISTWYPFEYDQFVITPILESTGKTNLFALKLTPQHD
jgi:hypothetical protein